MKLLDRLFRRPGTLGFDEHLPLSHVRLLVCQQCGKPATRRVSWGETVRDERGTLHQIGGQDCCDECSVSLSAVFPMSSLGDWEAL